MLRNIFNGSLERGLDLGVLPWWAEVPKLETVLPWVALGSAWCPWDLTQHSRACARAAGTE